MRLFKTISWRLIILQVQLNSLFLFKLRIFDMRCRTTYCFFIYGNRPLDINFALLTMISIILRHIRNSWYWILRFTANVKARFGNIFLRLQCNCSFFIPVCITLLDMIFILRWTWTNSSSNSVFGIVWFDFLLFFKSLSSILYFCFNSIYFFLLFILLLFPDDIWHLLPFSIESNVAFRISTIWFAW